MWNFKRINYLCIRMVYETIKRVNNTLASSLIVFISFNSTLVHASDWINPAGGLYHDPSNWSTGVPIPDSGGVFNLSSTGYTVNFTNSAATGTMQIINDTVTFDLGSNFLSLHFLSSTAPNLLIGVSGTTADLTIQNGLLFTTANAFGNTSGARIAAFSGATGSFTVDGLGIPNGTTWQHIGDFTIGGGDNSTGTFNVLNGAVVQTEGTVWMGQPFNSVNSSILIDNATWNHTDAGTIGGFLESGNTAASITIQNGGNLSTQETILGGANNSIDVSTASVIVTGNGSSWQADSFLLGTGNITVNSGANLSTTGFLKIGDDFYSRSFTVTVDGASSSVNVGGNMTLGGDYGYSQGHLNISNAAKVTVTGNMAMNGYGNPTGSDVTVNGINSELSVAGQIELFFNAGALSVQDGGKVVTNTLNLGQQLGFGADEKLHVTGNGSVVATTVNNFTGTIDLQGSTIQANIQNFNDINASGPASNTIDGDVTNNGTIKTTDTTLTVTGTLTNNGVYISDPSDNIFGNIVVGSDGYLVGGLDDRFIVHGDFTNNSTQASLWDTGLSTLIFDTAEIGRAHV